MELHREQIIKAMQDCIDRPNCMDCHNLTLCAGHGVEYLLVNALSLIKQLTEEVNDLKEDKELYSVFCEDYKGQIEDLKAISKQYQKQFEDCYEEKAKLTEENERLEDNLIKQSAENIMLLIDKQKIKADTVQKYREALYRAFAHSDSKDKFNKEVFLTKADQIAKEMVEGAGNG